MVDNCCSEVKSVRFLESTGMKKVCGDCDKISIVRAVIYGPTQTQDVTLELKEYNIQIECPLDCFYVDTGALNAYPGGDIEFGYRKAIQVEYIHEKYDKCEDKCEDNGNKDVNKTTATSTIGDVIVNVKLNSAYDNDNDYKHESRSRYRQDNSYRGNTTDNTNNSNQGNTDNTNNSNQGNTDKTNNSNQGNTDNSNQGNTDNSNQGNTENTNNNNNNSNQGNIKVRPNRRCGVCNRRFKRCICQCLEVNPIINCRNCHDDHNKPCKVKNCHDDHNKPCKVNMNSMLYIPLYSTGRPYLCPNSKKCH